MEAYYVLLFLDFCFTELEWVHNC